MTASAVRTHTLSYPNGERKSATRTEAVAAIREERVLGGVREGVEGLPQPVVLLEDARVIGVGLDDADI